MTEERFDAVIVGAGTAGMPCAITAAQHGARVAVVEKTEEVGGSLHLSAGSMSAAGTRRQRERGIDDDPEVHLDDIVRITRGTANAELVRLAVEEAGPAVDWLDGLGYAFDESAPVIYAGYEPYSRARVYFGQDVARSIYVVLRPLWDEQVAAGGIVPFLGTSLDNLSSSSGRSSASVPPESRTRWSFAPTQSCSRPAGTARIRSFSVSSHQAALVW